MNPHLGLLFSSKLKYNRIVHEIVTIIAKYFIALAVLLAVIVWFKVSTAEKKRFIVLAILGAIFSLVLAKIGNKIYSDPRPFVAGHFTPYFSHAADNGFPSDHTLLTSFLAFTTWRFSRKAGLAIFFIALLVGLSRVIAGVHHLVDIIGSVVFAFIGVWLADLIVSQVVKQKPTYQTPERRSEV